MTVAVLTALLILLAGKKTVALEGANA